MSGIEILYFILACGFGIVAVMYYVPKAQIGKSSIIAFHYALACIMSFNYACFLITTTAPLKNIFFTIHLFLMLMLCLAISDFICTLSKAKKRSHNLVFLLCILFVCVLSYCFFPVTAFLDITKPIEWNGAYRRILQAPFVIVFLSSIILLLVVNIRFLFYYYKHSGNIKRKKFISYFLGAAIILSVLVNAIDTIVKIAYLKTSAYYDLLVITILIYLLTIIICQDFFYILELTTNSLLYKIIDKTPESIAVCDYKLRLIWCNKNFIKIFSPNTTAVNHPTIRSFILKDAPDSTFKTKSKIQTNITVADKNYDMLFTSLPIFSNDGDFMSGIYYIQDITSFENRKKDIYRIKENLKLKILNRTISLKKLNFRLKKLIAEKIAQEEKNFYVLNYDLPTGLCNRKTIIQKLNALISYMPKIYLIYLDIDDVKMLNDSLGHDVVDIVIKKFAKRLQHLPYNKSAARFGSDEFLILLDGTEDVHRVCRDIQYLVSKAFTVNGTEVKITVSIGVSSYPNDGIDATALIRFADMAMNESKEKGKNCISYFNAKLKTKMETDFFISGQIKNDLLNDRINILLNPLVCFDHNGKRNISAFETVVHWYHRENECLSDEIFTDIIRRAGLLKKFDRWLFSTAVKKVSTNKYFKAHHDFKLIVALSEQSFYNPVFFDYIIEVISSCNIRTQQIEIEISETTLMINPELATKNIKQFQQFGMDTIIKNFGVSYSSLSFMNRLDFSKIKLSRVFISEIGKNAKDEGIIRLLILLAQRINIKISAEGVENAEQLRFLLKNGCKLFQGTFFSEAILIDDFLKILDSDVVWI